MCMHGYMLSKYACISLMPRPYSIACGKKGLIFNFGNVQQDLDVANQIAE